MEVINYAVRKERGSSYIPTPAKYSNPKCGLINIQNDDELCFKWRTLYHQTEQKKNDDRISVLKKVRDKCSWGIGKLVASCKAVSYTLMPMPTL